MGYATPIVGHVTTVTRGVSVSNAAPGAQGLPNIDPVLLGYGWRSGRRSASPYWREQIGHLRDQSVTILERAGRTRVCNRGLV